MRKTMVLMFLIFIYLPADFVLFTSVIFLNVTAAFHAVFFGYQHFKNYHKRIDWTRLRLRLEVTKLIFWANNQ